MILRLRSEILKDHLLHEPLHEVPVLDDPMSYRPLRQEKADASAGAGGQGDPGRAHGGCETGAGGCAAGGSGVLTAERGRPRQSRSVTSALLGPVLSTEAEARRPMAMAAGPARRQRPEPRLTQVGARLVSSEPAGGSPHLPGTPPCALGSATSRDPPPRKHHFQRRQQASRPARGKRPRPPLPSDEPSASRHPLPATRRDASPPSPPWWHRWAYPRPRPR